jgi:hypothetical protein
MLGSRRHRALAHQAPRDSAPWLEQYPSGLEVLSDTAELYRYFDCTGAPEFFCGCVAHAIDEDLPREIDFLRRNDEAKRPIMNLVEMPDR